MKIRTLTLGLLVVGCVALPRPVFAQVSTDDFNALKDAVQKMGQQVQELMKLHEQDQKVHEQDQKKIQGLQQQLGETKTAVNNAQQKAEEVAKVQSAYPVANGPSALHNFTMVGDAEVQFGKTAGQHSAFALADFAPIFLFRASDNVLFEAGFDFMLQNNAPAGGGYNTTVNLSFATLDYLVNDYMTVVAGNMLLPLGTYCERSAGMLNKIPDSPLPRGVLPGNGVGVQLRGAIPIGQSGQHLTYPQPLAYHPLHEQHSFEKFGCTICHRGQGRATTRADAHGNVAHWNEPMLPLQYIQASCGKCHQASDNPSAPELAQGQQVFEESGCRGCHKLAGVSGVIGPDLDRVGARRLPEWLKKHFLTPAVLTPSSAMPPQIFSVTNLEAITLFMLSLTGEAAPGYYASMKVIPSAAEGQKLFQQKGCIGCHSVASQGGKVGPALDDVGLRRTPDWMMQHFRDPQSVTPGSVMPKFGFTETEARALTDFLLHLRERNMASSLSALMAPVERGREIYRKYGCAGCHGPDGKGGVPNPNSKTAEQVPGLLHVADGYTKAELQARILNGQREIPALDAKRPPPPLYMPPWRGVIKDAELDDLVAYLISLKPKGEDPGF